MFQNLLIYIGSAIQDESTEPSIMFPEFFYTNSDELGGLWCGQQSA